MVDVKLNFYLISPATKVAHLTLRGVHRNNIEDFPGRRRRRLRKKANLKRIISEFPGDPVFIHAEVQGVQSYLLPRVEGSQLHIWFCVNRSPSIQFNSMYCFLGGLISFAYEP